jgi:hypothetical protein
MLRRRRDIPTLLASLDDDEPKVVADAINELAGRLDRLLPDQRERLAQAAQAGIGSREPALRGQALFALGDLGADLDLFEVALADPDWFVRLVAVSTLARVAPPIRVDAIARLRDDPEQLVRDSVAATLEEHDERGIPKPRAPEPTSLATWWTRERAMIRKDLVRRDGWNFVLWMSTFAVVIAGMLALSRATVGQAVGLAAVVTVAFAPLLWLRSWKGDHPWHPTTRFDRLEWLIAFVWTVVTIAVASAADLA